MINPFFVSPEFGTNDVNAQIEELFIRNLGENFCPTILCKPNSVKSNKIEVPHNDFLRTIERKCHSYILSPDSWHYSWAKFAKKTLLERNDFPYDYIHTFSIPYSSHLLGRDIKRKFKKPWVAHFFEPWYDNSYLNLDNEILYKRIVQRWERLVAEDADIIIHNSDIMYDLWLERYGSRIKDKMFVQNLPFDPRILSSGYNNNTDKFIISHIGNLFGLRTCIPFVKAVSKLLVLKPEIRNKLTINLVGKIQKSDLLFISQENLLDVFNIVGSIPESDCGKYYQMTDLFLVIEGENQGKLFFPSKIIKYFYYGRPILGLTTEGSVLYNELKKTNNWCYNNNDINSIVFFLERAIEDYKDVCRNDTSYWKNFDVIKIVEEYKKIVKNILYNIE